MGKILHFVLICFFPIRMSDYNHTQALFTMLNSLIHYWIPDKLTAEHSSSFKSHIFQSVTSSNYKNPHSDYLVLCGKFSPDDAKFHLFVYKLSWMQVFFLFNNVCSTSLESSYLRTKYESSISVLVRRLTSGMENTLFQYVSFNSLHGVIVCPTTSENLSTGGAVHLEVIKAFHNSCLVIRRMFQPYYKQVGNSYALLLQR